jgi:hypothetical protein
MNPRPARQWARQRLVLPVARSWSKRGEGRFAVHGSVVAVRFAVAIVAVVLLALAGLFVFGLTLKPDTRTIEQDAVGLPDA